MNEKMPSGENNEFDQRAEDAEIKKLVEEQEAEENAQQEKEHNEILDDTRRDKLVEGMEADEQARNAKRILDEVKDKKEEDGGEQRE